MIGGLAADEHIAGMVPAAADWRLGSDGAPAASARWCCGYFVDARRGPQAEAQGKEVAVDVLQSNVSEAQRCAAIVRSMLQFARDDSAEKRVADINASIRRADSATTNYALARSAVICLSLTDDPLPISMCAIEVDQILVNILRNAVESKPYGGRIEVRSQSCGARSRIQVRDDGMGIAADDLERIFDPFFSTRVEQGGTGLGLSVAHGIVADHGGEIWAESERGSGTTPPRGRAPQDRIRHRSRHRTWSRVGALISCAPSPETRPSR